MEHDFKNMCTARYTNYATRSKCLVFTAYLFVYKEKEK